MLQFTHLLMEAKSKYSPNIKPYLKTHDIVDSVDGFSHIALNYHMFPPIRIKTKPIIFIMKRKTNIKYDPDKAKSRVSTKDFSQQMEKEEEKLNASREMTTETKSISDDIVESSENFGKPEVIDIQNVSGIIVEHIVQTNDNTEEEEKKHNDLADDSIVSVEHVQTANAGKLLPDLKNRIKEDLNLQEDSENVSNIDDAKSDEEIKPKIEESKVIKGRLKNNLKLRQESHSIKETVKKMIQEKMQEVRQKREIKDEQTNMEFPIRPMKKKEVVETELPRKIKILKQELKETSVSADKPPMVKERIKVTKEIIRDEDAVSKQKFIKTRNITQIEDKIKAMKVDMEQIMEEEDATVEQENETVDMTTEKIVMARVKVDTESSIIQEKIIEEEDKENIKAPKLLNVRESIRNIINQFKEFERDFLYDDADSKASAPDTSDMNRIESDLKAKDNGAVDHVAESGNQLAMKDPRESLREIIDQFKYINHELTSEEDDQFDDIAAKYMERPIAETLLQFNEALKSLMQRRKKTSQPEQASNLRSNKDDHTSEDPLQTKYAEKARVAESDHNNERAKVLKIKPKSKQENVIINRPKDDLNVVPNVNKDTDTLVNAREVPMNSERHNNDKILNNVNKIDAVKKENSQKNTENSRSE